MRFEAIAVMAADGLAEQVCCRVLGLPGTGARGRLDVAAQRLHSTAEPIGAVACSVGYTYPYAFSRYHGQPSGR